MCGFYHKRILQILESEIQKENYSLFKLLEKIDTSYVPFGNDQRFLNMNTQNDFNKIISLLY
jgi:molybdopterin-guanine dinucleotide biosynthesis protein A